MDVILRLGGSFCQLRRCGDDDAGGFDAGVDAMSTDAGADASTDASVDGGNDASVDGGNDASADGGADASVDGGTDAGDATMVDAGPCVIQHGETSGEATVYENSEFTQCGAGLTPWTGLRIAVAPDVLMDGARCGACLRVTGPGGTHIALIDDLCPSCAAEDLDLQTAAAMTILGTTDGRTPVTWELAPCEPPGNVFYDFQGSNPFYIKIRVSQQNAQTTEAVSSRWSHN